MTLLHIENESGYGAHIEFEFTTHGDGDAWYTLDTWKTAQHNSDTGYYHRRNFSNFKAALKNYNKFNAAHGLPVAW